MDLLCWDSADPTPATLALPPKTTARSRGHQVKHHLPGKHPLPRRAATLTAWKQRLPLDPGSPSLGSWLTRIKGTSLGCIACEEGWATCSDRMRYSNLVRHSRTRAHQKNVEKLLGRKICPDPDVAPPLELFVAVLRDRRRGLSFRASGKGELPGGPVKEEKIVRLTWCLGEALLDEDREFFGRPGVVLAIHQDVRADFLCCRYASCCPHDLTRREGVLGLIQDAGGSSAELAEATSVMFQQICTPRLSPPRRSKQLKPPTADPTLLAKLTASVELFVADGASDEQKAGRILAGKSSSAPSLPNLKAVIKDKTHAMVRPRAQHV